MEKKGFTLIELLVVMAVIALLATMVLVSLKSVRLKARDTRIKADLEQIRNIAEMIFESYSSYQQLCSGTSLNTNPAMVYGPQLGTLDSDINTQNGGKGKATCYASQDNYCVSAPLATVGHVCIGAAGKFQATSSPCATTTSCD